MRNPAACVIRSSHNYYCEQRPPELPAAYFPLAKWNAAMIGHRDPRPPLATVLWLIA